MTAQTVAYLKANEFTLTGAPGRIVVQNMDDVCDSYLNIVPAVVSAAGTNQGTATVLTSQLNVVTTVAPGTGVVAPAGYSKNWNAGANAMLMYPPSGAQFDANGTNNPVSVAVGGIVDIIMTSSTQGYAR